MPIFDKHGPAYQEILAPLKTLFQNVSWWTMSQSFINKSEYFTTLIKFMQKRMKAKCQTVDAKVEVLQIHWAK